MAGVAQGRPGAQARRRRLRPALTRKRTQLPHDLACAVRQPRENALTGTIRSRGSGAEVAPPFGLNTGSEDRSAWNRFQAVRPRRLRVSRVTKRHIVLAE